MEPYFKVLQLVFIFEVLQLIIFEYLFTILQDVNNTGPGRNTSFFSL